MGKRKLVQTHNIFSVRCISSQSFQDGAVIYSRLWEWQLLKLALKQVLFPTISTNFLVLYEPLEIQVFSNSVNSRIWQIPHKEWKKWLSSSKTKAIWIAYYILLLNRWCKFFNISTLLTHLDKFWKIWESIEYTLQFLHIPRSWEESTLLYMQLNPKVSLANMPAYKNQDWMPWKLKCTQAKQSSISILQ